MEGPVDASRKEVRPGNLRIGSVLFAGLLAVSCGSIFAKLAQEAPAVTVAFYRMLWATVSLFPFYLVDRSKTGQTNLAGRTPVAFIWWAVAGFALAMHFAFWIGSLYYTTVAVSVLLVNTAPIFSALISYVLFGERLTRSGWLGILLAFLGAAALVGSDVVRISSWKGPLLACLGALMFGVYLVAGRAIRQSRGLLQYVYPTYALSALILALLVWLTGSSLGGFKMSTFVFMMLLGVVPQSIGHTSYNWALRYLPATLVAMLVMAEPAGASALAFWVLDEGLGWGVLGGGCLVVVGIYLVAAHGIRSVSDSSSRECNEHC